MQYKIINTHAHQENVQKKLKHHWYTVITSLIAWRSRAHTLMRETHSVQNACNSKRIRESTVIIITLHSVRVMHTLDYIEQKKKIKQECHNLRCGG